MSIWDKWAQGINRVVTGNRRRRAIVTPIAAIIFFGIITLFVLSASPVDNWLGLPHLPEAWWRYELATLVFLAGITIAGWTVTRFFLTRGTPVPTSPPPKLVTTGLYGYVRNPMALGGWLILEGLGLYTGSLSLIFVFAPLPLLLYALFIKAVEEKELEIRFGQEYRDYKEHVPMFIPRLRRRG
ncbi:MAG: isoprenylcysteine carboxylmethyltransferase family protein [Chloroflexi bacterium]|nr:isoprenylcysteine carboxylmethyltransferase family protein [Chloroflexota bacterium]